MEHEKRLEIIFLLNAHIVPILLLAWPPPTLWIELSATLLAALQASLSAKMSVTLSVALLEVLSAPLGITVSLTNGLAVSCTDDRTDSLTVSYVAWLEMRAVFLTSTSIIDENRLRKKSLIF